MASAYKALANLTLSSSASTVTFSSISGNYRDLVLVISDIKMSTDATVYIRYNSDTGSNYNQVFMSGQGSVTASQSANSTRFDIGYYTYASTTDTGFNIEADILDYTATDKHKTAIVRSNRASAGTESFAARWASTSAITTIALIASTGTFSSGTKFALYGVTS